MGYASTENVGDDEAPSSVGPVQLGGIALEVALGGAHTCALLLEGDVRCWGSDNEAQLGRAGSLLRPIGDDEHPASVEGVSLGGKAIQVVAGRLHSCALLTNGKVRCWGRNADGQLGYARKEEWGELPSVAGDVEVGGSVAQLYAGPFHNCVLLTNGKVRCWGYNAAGQLGYDRFDNIGDDEVPASAGDVALPGPATQVVAGYRHTCALLADRSVVCWGGLGRGLLEPIPVGGLVASIASGEYHVCAALDGGQVRCWGHDVFLRGALGYGHTEAVDDPAAAGNVDLGGSAVQIAAGEHTCALLDNGALRCWGDNRAGQLGYGHTNDIGDDEAPASAGDVQYRE